MKKEAKLLLNRWIKALESHKYFQETRQLKYLDGFCGLGVLCEIEGKKAKKNIWKYNSKFGEIDTIVGFSPEDILKKAGIPPRSVDSLMEAVTYANDTLEYSFLDIADWLREYKNTGNMRTIEG